MTITNRELLVAQFATRALVMLALTGGLIWGFAARIINGEGYLGFMVAIIAFLKEIRVMWLDEAPRVVASDAKEGANDGAAV